MNEDENGAKKFRLLYSFRKICKGGWDDGRRKTKAVGLFCSPNAHTRYWWISLVALVLAKRAAGINRIVRMAVLVHARTFGLIQPAPYEKDKLAWRDR